MCIMKQTRVLLADDHAVVRAGIRNALTELSDIEIVAEVGDGPAVVAALSSMQIDLLLLDVTMPEFDPVVQIGQFRANYPTLKILVVSAYDDDIYVQGLLSAGVDGYHLKDQPLSDLRLAVTRVIAGERWVSSRLVTKLVSSSDSAATEQNTSHEHSVSLTARQQDILALLYEGLDNQAIARRMTISTKTVENHLTRLYRQLDVQSRLEAVNYAIQNPAILGGRGPNQDCAFNASGPQVGRTNNASTSYRDGDSRPGYPPANNQNGHVSHKANHANTDILTILLVDDNHRYRQQLGQMVSSIQVQSKLYEAANIRIAETQAQEHRPDLAFVDVVLGDEDGIDCTRKLKAICPSVRIVLISAYPDREFHNRGLDAGAVALLDKKDLDARALRQVMDDAISM